MKFDSNDAKAFVVGMMASMAAVVAWDIVKKSLRIFNYNDKNIK